MKYKLANENYTKNYVEQLISFYGANAQTLLNPDDSLLQSPENLSKIEKGAQLFLSVLQSENSNICIIVDCDTDGYTSASIIWMYIKKIFPQTNLYYKIHSGKQHGLEDMMEEIINDEIKYSLIILPDSSSNDGMYHLELKDIGIPCLVLDHHIYDGDTFNAVIINNQLSPEYNNKELTGAGVVFQFCRYIDKKLNVNYAWDFIDLAALGIISDMGSVLEYENRYIIKKGLEKNNKNFFFQTLIDKQSFSIGDNLNAIAISFYITPLINALIRVGSMEEKEKLFEAFIDGTRKIPSTKRGEKGQLEMLATQMARTCTNARNHQNIDKDKAVENLSIRIENEGLNQHQIILVLLQEEDDFPSTLNGLIAMQLCAKYKRPTLVLRPNKEGYARGSARGPSDTEFPSLKRYLDSTELFEYNAGHDMAHGSSIKIKYIDELLKKADKELACYDFNNEFYNVNFIRKSFDNDINNIIYDIDKYKSIWGQGCPEPVIAITNIDINKKDISVVGKNKDTIRFSINGITYIKFHAKEMIQDLNKYDNMRLEIIGRASVNEWMGTSSPQIFIDNYNVEDNTLLF